MTEKKLDELISKVENINRIVLQKKDESSDIKQFQILKNIKENQDIYFGMMKDQDATIKLLINDQSQQNAKVTERIIAFEDKAYEKINHVQNEMKESQKETRTMVDTILADGMETKDKVRLLNDRLESVEESFCEISAKICGEDVRKNCEIWSEPENVEAINMNLEKSKSYKITKKTIKEKFKNNIIDIITNPMKYPEVAGKVILLGAGIFGVFKFIQELLIWLNNSHTP